MTVEVRVPGSKSITHRAMLLAARSSTPCTIEDALRSDDTDAMRRGLRAMGYRLTADGTTIHSTPSTARPAVKPIQCGNSGTALRLLSAEAARHPWTTRFEGDQSLNRRPMAPLMEAIRPHGVRGDKDRAPLEVTGPMRPGDYLVDSSVSSQYASALLMALPSLPGDSTVQLTGDVVSKPYIDLTIRVMERFGLHVGTDDDGRYHIEGGQVPKGDAFHVEPDWSTAAFYLVAGAITEGVHIPGLNTGTGQPDEAIMDILGAFGVQVEDTSEGVTVYPGPIISAGTIDVRDHPDLFPPLAILAACADGKTTFTGGAHLHVKETDRIHAMVEGLARMGVSAKERPDGMVVPGGRMHGTSIHAYGDHRIHMAFQVASLVATSHVAVDGADTVSVSHPDFHFGLRPFQKVMG